MGNHNSNASNSKKKKSGRQFNALAEHKYVKIQQPSPEKIETLQSMPDIDLRELLSNALKSLIRIRWHIFFFYEYIHCNVPCIETSKQ